jgi:sec-independent protein translocase protein TatA
MIGEIFGPDLLIVVLVLVVVLFGGAAIPKLARNLGSAKKEFEKGIHEGHAEEATPGTTTVVKPVVIKEVTTNSNLEHTPPQ